MKNRAFPRRLGFALAGISSAWRHEKSFRQQCVAALAVVVFLIWWKPPLVWSALLFATVGN